MSSQTLPSARPLTPPLVGSPGEIQRPTRKRSHFAYIDGLRGIAAFWVVCYHVWNRFYPGLSTQGHVFVHPASATPGFYLTFVFVQYGYIGVDLFFVLSGFCIHLSQAKQKGGQGFRPGEFAKRRFWRLYPAYLASLIFSVLLVASLPLLNSIITRKTIDWMGLFQVKDVAANATFLQMVWPHALSLNGVYWTLLYEVQFYAFYPVLLYLTRKCSLKSLLLLLLTIEVICAYHEFPITCLFLYRYYEWFLGMVAAELVTSNPRLPQWRMVPPLTCVMLCCGFVSVFVPAIYPLRDAFFSTGFFGLLLIIPGRISNSALFRLLENRWAVGIGAFSYSLYLIHIPVIDIFWNSLTIVSKHSHLSRVTAHSLALLCIPAALAVAYVFYRLFEKPFLSAKKVQST